MKKRYWVEPSRTLIHDDQRYEGGQIVELDDAAARTLLELGAILEYDPLAPRSPVPDLEPEAEAEDKPETEAKAEAALQRRGRPRR